MSSSSIRLVVFDLGGVLLRICRSWQESCAAAEIEVRGECVNGLPTIADWQEINLQFNTGRINGQAWAAKLCAGINDLYTAPEVMKIHHAVLLGEYEGVGKIIERIHEVGLPTAALSNTNEDHWRRMDEFSSVMKLRHRLASHELQLHKPDPAIYRALEKQLRFRGGEILFFDDLPENIDAARSLDWNTQLINPHVNTAPQIEAALKRHGVFTREREHKQSMV